MLNQEKIKVLDSLRGVLSFLVVFQHLGISVTRIFPDETYIYLVRLGYFAVDCFFFISGFILTHVYAKKMLESMNLEKKTDDEESTNNDNTGPNKGFLRMFSGYFWSRIARLYPLVFLSESLTVLLKYLEGKAGWGCLWEYFLICSWADEWYGNQPLWSLNVEFTLYLLFPIFLWFNKKIIMTINEDDLKIKVLLALSSIIPIFFNISRIFCNYGEDFSPIVRFGAFFRGVQGFYAGICFYQVYELKPEKEKRNDFLCLGALVLNILILIFGKEVYSYLYFWFVFAFLLVKSNSFMKSLFEGQILIFLGKISFSIYLLHLPILIFLNEYVTGEILMENLNYLNKLFIVLGYYSFMIIVSYLVYSYFESPSRDYLRMVWIKINKLVYEEKLINKESANSS